MRKIDSLGHTPSRQTIQYNQRTQFPSNVLLPSLNGISIPPLNLSKPISHSMIFVSTQEIQKPDISTRRQDQSCWKTQRSDKIMQQLHTERQIKQQGLLSQNKMLKSQNQKLKLELNQYKRFFTLQFQKLKQQNHKLIKDNKQLFILIDLKQKQKKPRQSIDNSKQSKLYSEIIDKLQKRVDLLLKQSKTLKQSLEIKVLELGDAHKIFKFYESLKSQVLDLQKLVHQDKNQWQYMKKQWNKQKNNYLETINRLESKLKYR